MKFFKFSNFQIARAPQQLPLNLVGVPFPNAMHRWCIGRQLNWVREGRRRTRRRTRRRIRHLVLACGTLMHGQREV